MHNENNQRRRNKQRRTAHIKRCTHTEPAAQIAAHQRSHNRAAGNRGLHQAHPPAHLLLRQRRGRHRQTRWHKAGNNAAEHAHKQKLIHILTYACKKIRQSQTIACTHRHLALPDTVRQRAPVRCHHSAAHKGYRKGYAGPEVYVGLRNMQLTQKINGQKWHAHCIAGTA